MLNLRFMTDLVMTTHGRNALTNQKYPVTRNRIGLYFQLSSLVYFLNGKGVTLSIFTPFQQPNEQSTPYLIQRWIIFISDNATSPFSKLCPADRLRQR